MGKASSSATKGKRKCWRTVTRKGVTYLLSPDGRKYIGTPAEVREAALMPWRRDWLAQSLKLQMYLRHRGTLDAEEFKACCSACRRDAVMYGAFDVEHGTSIQIPASMYLLLSAFSRLVKDSPTDYLREVLKSELCALIDVADEDKGARVVPFNRHEEQALLRIGIDKDFILNADYARIEELVDCAFSGAER